MLDGNLRPGATTYIVELERDSWSLVMGLLQKYIDRAEDCDDKTLAISSLKELKLQTDCIPKTSLQGDGFILPTSTSIAEILVVNYD